MRHQKTFNLIYDLVTCLNAINVDQWPRLAQTPADDFHSMLKKLNDSFESIKSWEGEVVVNFDDYAETMALTYIAVPFRVPGKVGDAEHVSAGTLHITVLEAGVTDLSMYLDGIVATDMVGVNRDEPFIVLRAQRVPETDMMTRIQTEFVPQQETKEYVNRLKDTFMMLIGQGYFDVEGDKFLKNLHSTLNILH